MKSCLFFVLLIAFGCVAQNLNLQLTNFKSGQSLQGATLNKSNKEVTVVMQDGEVLKGKYITMRDKSISSGSIKPKTRLSLNPQLSRSQGLNVKSVTVSNTGKGYALLKSSSSKLMMEINFIFSGNHGFGDARTNDGRTYKVQF